MKQEQDPIVRLKAECAKEGLELSDDLSTVRVTARCLPDEPEELTEEQMEDMTPEEIARERKKNLEWEWNSFTGHLVGSLRRAHLYEAVYLSDSKYPDVVYRDFSAFAEAYRVRCDSEEPSWDETMGVRLSTQLPRAVVVDPDHPCLSARDGVLFNKDQTELIWYPYGKAGETYTVPDGVKKIGKGAFAATMHTVTQRYQDGSPVEQLWRTVSANVIDSDGGGGVEYETRTAKVVKYVFNRDLLRVVLPDTVTEIGPEAFDHCIFLKSVKLPSALEEIGYKAFKGCKELREISLPDSLERLTPYETDGAYYTSFFPDNLERVNFLGARCRLQPFAVYQTWRCRTQELIEPYTPGFFFEMFKSELDVTITFAAENERFSSEDGVIFNKDKTELIYCPQWKSGAYTVPRTVTRVREKAFANCGELTRVVFAGGAVTDIEDRAFYGCSSLREIGLRGVKRVGKEAFLLCTALGRVDLDGAEHIGDKAFSSCKALAHIGLRGVEHIGDEAFSYCEALTHIELDCVKYIGYKAFENCSALGPTVTIPGSCEQMSEFAFSWKKDFSTKAKEPSLKTLRVPQDTRMFNPKGYSRFSHILDGVYLPEVVRY